MYKRLNFKLAKLMNNFGDELRVKNADDFRNNYRNSSRQSFLMVFGRTTPYFSAICRIFSVVSALISELPDSALETVETDTPASSAILRYVMTKATRFYARFYV